VKYSPVWHDPQGSLSFLKEDLAQKVGTSGHPVVLMAHCGFDTDWWCAEDWAELYQAAKPYNVVLYLHGHSGTSVGAWAPAGEDKKLTLINDGQSTTGFFVINLSGERLRAAYRMKCGVQFTKAPDGKQEHTWDGRWEWKWLLDQKISEWKAN
jgi:cytolysin (calcineurin-like family phosphatase)